MNWISNTKKILRIIPKKNRRVKNLLSSWVVNKGINKIIKKIRDKLKTEPGEKVFNNPNKKPIVIAIINKFLFLNNNKSFLMLIIHSSLR
jgi:hypothetical protein